MGLAHSPSIVTDGLVLCVDAANTKSYPGSGTTWTDISGKGHNGTLINGPTFSSDNMGGIVFDGSNDAVTLSANSDFDFGTGNFTIDGFANYNSGNFRTLVCSEHYYASGYNGNWIIRVTNTGALAFASYDGQSNEEYSEFSITITSNKWFYFAFVREGTGSNECKFYFNGVLVGSMTVSKSLSNAGNEGLRIGQDLDGPNNNFLGKISNVKIYKGKGLTATEVLQNYNSHKGRFGL